MAISRLPVARDTTTHPPPAVGVRGAANAFRSFFRTYWVPLAVFAASRIVDGVFLVIAAQHQVALPHTRPDYHVFEPTPADPGYLGIVANWDGQWYSRIATHGYETDADGPTSWTWAFPPGYPLLVRALMLVTGLPFAWAASIVSILAGAAAIILLYRIVLRYGGAFLALTTVAFACFFVSAPLLQIGYSESLALLLLTATLNLVADRRYGWAGACIVALAYTRIVTLPLVAVLAVHAYFRWKAEGPFWRASPAQAVRLAFAAVVSVAGSVAWMLTAAAFIGLSEGTRRSSGQRGLYQGWFKDVNDVYGVVGLLLLLAFIALLLLNALAPRARYLGPELRAWTVAYPLYIFWFTPLLPAAWRYMLLVPTLPVLLAGVPRRATPRSVALVAVVVCGLLVAQYWYASHVVVVYTEGLLHAP